MDSLPLSNAKPNRRARRACRRKSVFPQRQLDALYVASWRYNRGVGIAHQQGATEITDTVEMVRLGAAPSLSDYFRKLRRREPS